MENFFRSKRFKILITVIAVLFGIMLYGASSDGVASIPEKMLSYLTWPFQQISSAATGATTGFFDKYLHVDDTIAERDALQQEVNDLRSQLIDDTQLQQENESLRTMLGIAQEHQDYTFLNASIIGWDQKSTFTINKGENHGVAVNDAIITDAGLVGIVSKVSSTTATVKTLYSTAIDVGAKELNSGKIGVVTGDLNLAEDGYCRMQYLESEVSIGDTIVTSGSGGILPSGLAIGRVVDVQLERNSPTYYATIEPFNDIEELTQVFVITSFAGQDQG